MLREFISNADIHFLTVCKTVIVIWVIFVIAVLHNVVKLILYNFLSFCLLCYLIGLQQIYKCTRLLCSGGVKNEIWFE